MKIASVTSQVLVWPPLDPPFWMSLSPVDRPHELVVRVTSEDGLTGIGHSDQVSGIYMAGRDDRPRLANAARIVPEAIAPILRGQDPLATGHLWDTMFDLTHRRGWSAERWTRQQIMAAIAATDMALWDLKAKSLGLPVYRLLGGTKNKVPCYMAGGYYREGKGNDRLAQEMRRFRIQGYRYVKMRVGGLSIEEDAQRVRVAREALGPDANLLLDANEAYDSELAIRAASLFRDSNIFWFEEPVRWYEGHSAVRRVAEATGMAVAGGEQCPTHWDAAEYVDQTGIRFMEFDCMRTGGPTEWLRVAAYCDARGVPMAPHHGPHIHAHLVAAARNGLMVEVFPDPGGYTDREELGFTRWDRKREMFGLHPEIVDGEMVLDPARPGWGIELDEDAVGRRLVRE